MSLKSLPWITAGALSPGSADDKSSFTTTPGRDWRARNRKPVIPSEVEGSRGGIFDGMPRLLLGLTTALRSDRNDKLAGKKFAHRTCRRCAPTFLGQPNLTRFTPGLDCGAKGARHSIWVRCDRDRSIHQNGVRAHFHRFRRLARRAQSSINHHWDGCLFDDDFDLRPGFDPAITPDW